MWLPASEQEIRERAAADTIEETEVFDAKRDLGSNKDLAKDIAAMSTDGGVLLYGLGEDERKRPTVLNPIVLKGLTERISNVVQTGVAGSPTFRIRTIASTDDPDRGYVLVEVPMSANAPHQVLIGNDYRFYGRSGTTNRILTQGDIDRLYERRKRWEVNRAAMLDEVIATAPVSPQEGLAYLHLCARPVGTDETLLERAARSQGMRDFLRDLPIRAKSSPVFKGPMYPEFTGPSELLQQPTGWLLRLHGTWKGADLNAESLLDVFVANDGAVTLFAGRAAATTRGGNEFWFFDDGVAGHTVRFIGLLNILYRQGGYTGPIELGIAVTNLQGATSAIVGMRMNYNSRPYTGTDYRRHVATTTMGLEDDPYAVARNLVMPLVNTLNQGGYDPFAKWT